jgi:hypothetical protein
MKRGSADVIESTLKEIKLSAFPVVGSLLFVLWFPAVFADCTRWAQASVATPPTGPFDHGIASDGARERVAIFDGGAARGGFSERHAELEWNHLDPGLSGGFTF